MQLDSAFDGAVVAARVRLCALCLLASTACSSPRRTRDARAGAAAVHRALAVIAEFSDAHLGDWPGPGIASEAELRVRLDAIAAQWTALSHGREVLRWKVVRVELARPLASGAFASPGAFRAEVVRLARREIDPLAYDLDRDGAIDTLWIVAADRGHPAPFLAGGVSRTAGAEVFVDAQDTDRLRAGAISPIVHDVGRTRGLPELDGRIATLGDLSIMASSWPLPPSDFCAFDRLRLGWLDPERIAPGRRTVIVPDASAHLAALAIPADRPGEYFLLERRRRPTTGFDLVIGAAFDGIAVYHVRAGSDQDCDPPLIALEPAAGRTARDGRPRPEDLVFPDNPALRLPRRYLAYDGVEAFRIERVLALPDGSLAVELDVSPRPRTRLASAGPR